MPPEQEARAIIDDLLTAAGWQVQNRNAVNLGAARGVAVREYQLTTGPCDYLLFVDHRAIGVIEAKPIGTTLIGISPQSQRYASGLPPMLRTWHSPLPFAYESTGEDTRFTNGLDPDPRSRRVFAFHKPETLAEWAQAVPTLRQGLRELPPPITAGLWLPQVEAIANLERSFAANHPRALIQMATGSGKTFTTVNFVYRLIKYAGAKRVLFLVDRSNLGRQALKEFQQFTTPDDGRKISELYNIQHLQSNHVDEVSRVCITTVQRLYSMLLGQEAFDKELEEGSLLELGAGLPEPPRDVTYNPRLPIEYFDFIITDECHRSIYNLWRQVLEYFDAFLIGLTATPSRQTLGFFNQNLVMEYTRQRAVADGVNVDGQVYRIRTRVTEQGSTVPAGYYVGERDRRTRRERWSQLDEDLVYTSEQIDREVVAPDQIRTVIRAFKERLFTEMFYGRTVVPKTLIFAKDDEHAETIVGIVREVFEQGNDFCQKITYRVSGRPAEDLINDFRNSYNPRIAVTVDMMATGTDIRAIEVLLFMRMVKSRLLYEQMTGRGTRVINPSDLQAVTPDAQAKTRYVIVDAVGVTEVALQESTPSLDREPTVRFGRLLELVAGGMYNEDTLSTLAGRLVRLSRQLNADERETIVALTGGMSVNDIAATLLDAVDPDRRIELARQATDGSEPTLERVEAVGAELMMRAVEVFDSPEVRNTLMGAYGRNPLLIDTVTRDEVLTNPPVPPPSAVETVSDFRAYIEQHKDEIAALQLIYSRPYAQRRLTYVDIKELVKALQQPPHSWTTEALWEAYRQVERDRVRGVGAKRALTDVISLVRHALQLDEELMPFPDVVRQRYERWLADQQAVGRTFTAEQRAWLDRIAEHIGVNLSMEPAHFDMVFHDRGGKVGARRVLGEGWLAITNELNEALVSLPIREAHE